MQLHKEMECSLGLTLAAPDILTMYWRCFKNCNRTYSFGGKNVKTLFMCAI